MTATPLPPIDPEGSIPDRFAAAARAFPTRLAVRGQTASWTYEELDALSGRIAAALLDRSPDGGRPVLLLMANDSPLLAAMVGVLKAGLFYAPVDAGFAPAAAARLAGLAAPSLVVAGRGLLAAARTLVPGVAVVEVDELAAAGGAASRPAPRLPPVPATAFAYLLFTSGSTGTPKGILQTHRNVLANVARLGSGLRVVPGDRFTLLASASHGASVSDVYGALLHGAAVLPFAPRAVSPAAWRDWAAAEKITIWHSVPGLFRSLARAVASGGELPALRLCKLGGEPVFATDLELWKRGFREGGVFHVGLGMTEMNVVCQWFADHQTACPGPVAPIGRPAAGIGAVLIGPDGEPAAAADAGTEGELGIVATTLPVAYWRRPDLTAQAFQPVAGSAARLFRTGDLVRRLPGGELLHLGRRDRHDALLGVEQATGCAADMALFLEEPTPRGIARRLGGGRELLTQLAAHRGSPAAGGGAPVFWVPAHGAGEGPDLLQLARLARLARLSGPSLVLRLPAELPPTSAALLDGWSAAVLARQRQGPWRLVAACAGGPLGFALAGRLSLHGEVLLVLHDAQFPGRARRWRRILRRLREPWGDDLLARLRHHLVELSRRRLAAALGYAAGRARSAARGWQRMATPAQQRLSARQQAYLRLSLECRLASWPGEALLVVTPARRAQLLPELWRRLSPRLAVSLTGADTEAESAAAIRDFFARGEPPADAAV